VGRIEKMSKSKKNVIDPNILLEKYGADTTRLFCLFAAPPERDLEWSEQGVDGGYRFLNRVWRFFHTWIKIVADVPVYIGPPDDLGDRSRELYRKTHQTIEKVTRDIEDRYHFNTAISAVMELYNLMAGFEPGEVDPRLPGVMRHAMQTLVLMLSPIVPHVAEELWQALGSGSSILEAPWPVHDPSALAMNELLIVVQVNGKLRGKFSVGADADDAVIREMALADERVRKFIGDGPPKKVIVVKKKLVNIVV
jgi:leucyl-tRNA synthetase